MIKYVVQELQMGRDINVVIYQVERGRKVSVPQFQMLRGYGLNRWRDNRHHALNAAFTILRHYHLSIATSPYHKMDNRQLTEAITAHNAPDYLADKFLFNASATEVFITEDEIQHAGLHADADLGITTALRDAPDWLTETVQDSPPAIPDGYVDADSPRGRYLAALRYGIIPKP